MKKLILFYLVCFTLTAFGQDDEAFVMSQRKNFTVNSDKGELINTKISTEVKGTPYYDESWRSGQLILSNNDVKIHEKILFNCETNKIIVLNEDGKAYALHDYNILGFSLFSNKGYSVFVKIPSNKFSGDSKVTDDAFYKVISKDNNKLVKQIKKVLVDPNLSRGHSSALNSAKEYKNRAVYFAKNSDGIYQKTKLNKKNILNITSNKQAEIKSFVKTKKLSFKNEKDVAKILDYYHSL